MRLSKCLSKWVFLRVCKMQPQRRLVLAHLALMMILNGACSSQAPTLQEALQLTPAASLPSIDSFAAVTPTQRDKSIAWNFEKPHRTVSIGDIHGDLDALLTILTKAELIDGDGRWIGKDTHLVISGDLVNKGPHSRAALDFLMALEADIKSSKQGALHFIYGNHELMLMKGIFHATSSDDAKKMEALPFLKNNEVGDWTLKQSGDIWDLFHKNSIYGEFLSRQNSLVKVGDTLFVHAGLGRWAEKFTPDEINSTVRAWAQFYLSHKKQAGRPADGTEWAVGEFNDTLGFNDSEIGPIWGREFAPRDKNPTEKRKFEMALSRDELDKLLKKWGVKRVIIGHVPYADEVAVHPYYGGRVLLSDTRISRWSDPNKKGNLSWVEIDNTGNYTQHKTSLLKDVIDNGHPVRLTFEKEIKRLSKSASDGCSADLKQLLKILGH